MEHHLKISKTARYFTLGKLTEQTKSIWFVCHGYGQLAEYFVKNFEVLNPNEHYFVAPEGLHRFYLKGNYGRVGATWMTKEDRLSDIDDYMNLLNTVYDLVIKNINHQVQINVLGFSQGAATLGRWISNRHIKFNNIILWAGILPVEFDFEKEIKYLNQHNTYVLIGDKDEYINSDKVVEISNYLQSKRLNFELILFKGEHKIYDDVLVKLAEKLEAQ